jgi:hypothetical protein
VASSDGSVACGATCSATYAGGAQVTLVATPVSGSTFAGWGGACTGTGACQVTLSAAKAVEARFERLNVAVAVGQSREVQPDGERVLSASLTARSGCGPIQRVDFGMPGVPFDNARVTMTTPVLLPETPVNMTAGFSYTPPPGATKVALTVERVVHSGAAMVKPIRFFDGCGEWRTFLGGGINAFR